jgi:hypothetical protein
MERRDNQNPTGVTPEKEYLILNNTVHSSDTQTKIDTGPTNKWPRQKWISTLKKRRAQFHSNEMGDCREFLLKYLQ